MQTVMIRSGKVAQLVPEVGVTANTTGEAIYKDSAWSYFQATVVGTGAVTADVDIEASNDGVYWASTPIATISLSGSDTVSDGVNYVGPAKFVRAVISNVTGTGATVYVTMGL